MNVLKLMMEDVGCSLSIYIYVCIEETKRERGMFKNFGRVAC